MSMRVTMRQLLSRKSHQKLSDAEASDAFPPPSDFTGERVFPIPNLKDHLQPQSDSGDILGSVLNVIDGGQDREDQRSRYLTASRESGNGNSSGSGSGSGSTVPKDVSSHTSNYGPSSLKDNNDPRKTYRSSSRHSGLHNNDESRKVYSSSSRPSGLHDNDESRKIYSSSSRPSGLHDNDEPRKVYSSSSRSSVLHDNDESRKIYASSLGPDGLRDSDRSRKVSERTQYASSSKHGPPKVVTGAVAASATPTYHRCEDEPIHIPGAIQSFGALIGLQYNEHGSLEVRVASENARKILGYGPEQLFTLESFLDVLIPEDRHELIARIDHVHSNVDAIKDETRLDVFRMTLTFPYEPDARLWCAIHLASQPKGMVICEFEEYMDAFFLKDVGAAQILPVEPAPPIDAETSPEDLRKSTTSYSKPLAALKIARHKQNKEFSPLDVFNATTQAQKQLADCKSVQAVLDVVVGIISELTGFHRVMFYRFDSQQNGCIDAELLNSKANTVLFRGLHFPASDIPKQARDLYKINRIRILHDRDAETARLVARNESDFNLPLDLTHAYLRAMSPIHIKYLANMGVRSSMSISIVIDSNLWGLIACHGYGDYGTRVSLPIRELCRSIGDCTALHIQRLLMINRIEARRLPGLNSNLNSTKDPTSLMAGSSTELLKFIDADFALLSVEEQIRAIGRMEPYHEALAIMSYLQSCRFTGVRSSQNIKADFPGLSYPPGIKTLAGLLVIPLNVGEGNNFLVFFRRAQIKHVKWAGDPNGKTFQPGSEYLTPRTSFRRWVETINDTSKEWTEDQLDKASILGLLYGRFIETRRSQASPTATQTSEIDESSVSSSRHETFDLHLTASRFLEALKKESLRKGLQLTFQIAERLPGLVKGDSESFKKLLTYFTSNGFKQSINVKVDIELIDAKEETSSIRIRIQDTGPGMSEDELDDTFMKFEQAQGEEYLPFRNEVPKPKSAETQATTNDDLASTAQYVQSMNGQIMVASEVAKGTIYTVDLLFDYASPNDARKRSRKIRNLFSAPQGPPKDSLPSLPAPSMKSPISSKSPQSPKPNVNEEQLKVTTPSDPEFLRRGSHHSDKPLSASIKTNDYTPVTYPARSDTPSQHFNPNSPVKDSPAHLEILIVDSDVVSMKTLNEKLSELGHSVSFAHDGQDGHDRFASNPSKFDVIFMELKMPAVDGVLSTRMIRLVEREAKAQGSQSSRPRVPIIAISTFLDEDKRFEYIQSGFDGWMTKPVEFRRLDFMLQGLRNPEIRRGSLYIPGQLKKNGWFLP